MTALVFGASGQDGYYLTRLCRDRGIPVIGCSRSSGAWVQGDIGRRGDVERLIDAHRPEFIFHLAANSTTRHSALFENHATISTGTLNVLESAHSIVPQARVFITGSGVQFVNRGTPISERDEFAPLSAYAVARIHSVYAARYYRSLGARTFVGYLFHHESLLRRSSHVSMLIATAAQRIAAGADDVLELGDIDVEKEWTFAGDTAAAMLALVTQDTVHEATIGSGVGYTIRDWLDACFAVAGKDWRDHVRVKSGFSPEYRRLVSDPTTIRSLGWVPRVGLRELAVMMMQSAAQTSPEVGP